jgi:hypothetical protein
LFGAGSGSARRRSGEPIELVAVAQRDILRHPAPSGTVHEVDEEQGIYRGEVRSIMIALADITVDVRTILGYFEGDDDEEEEEGFSDP